MVSVHLVYSIKAMSQFCKKEKSLWHCIEVKAIDLLSAEIHTQICILEWILFNFLMSLQII